MMEGTRTAPFCTMLLLMCMLLPTSATLVQEQPKCSSDEYLHNGTCCNKCGQGYKLVKKCEKEGHRSWCTECPEGQFSSELNWAFNCNQCRRCKKQNHQIVVSACTPKRDAVCGCEEGFYKYAIDSVTFDCIRCKKCGPDEKETQTCTSEKDTVCECKKNYYKLNRKCEPCDTCTSDCEVHCPAESFTTTDRIADAFLINVIAGVAAVAIALLLVVVPVSVSLIRTRTSAGSQHPSHPSHPSSSSCSSGTCEDSPDSLTVLIQDEPSEKSLTAVPIGPGSEQESSNLPDCVPLEIKYPDLFYAVLDLVPVAQVKQLVRFLGVSDTEIDRAELDHPGSCQEAHYQMLKVWAQRGSQAGPRAGGGQAGMLHLPLLQQLIDKLRAMHLRLAAEELETKYGIMQ